MLQYHLERTCRRTLRPTRCSQKPGLRFLLGEPRFRRLHRRWVQMNEQSWRAEKTTTTTRRMYLHQPPLWLTGRIQKLHVIVRDEGRERRRLPLATQNARLTTLIWICHTQRQRHSSSYNLGCGEYNHERAYHATLGRSPSGHHVDHGLSRQLVQVVPDVRDVCLARCVPRITCVHWTYPTSL